MNRKHRILAILGVIFAVGCGAVTSTPADNSYANAATAYNVASSNYSMAVTKITNARAKGRDHVTDVQWSTLIADEHAVAAADAPLFAALQAWKATPTLVGKPPTYDALSANLTAAQGAVIALAAGVTP